MNDKKYDDVEKKANEIKERIRKYKLKGAESFDLQSAKHLGSILGESVSAELKKVLEENNKIFDIYNDSINLVMDKMIVFNRELQEEKSNRLATLRTIKWLIGVFTVINLMITGIGKLLALLR